MPEILVSAPEKPKGARSTEAWGSSVTAKALAWFGVIVVAAALSDFALALYPLGFGSAEWELATFSSIIQGLPLLSIGLAALWFSGGWQGKRDLLLGVGITLLVIAVILLVMTVMFLTNVPLALRATQDYVARLSIKKLVTKTLTLAVLFGGSYIVAGVLALKQARGVVQKGAVA